MPNVVAVEDAKNVQLDVKMGYFYRDLGKDIIMTLRQDWKQFINVLG